MRRPCGRPDEEARDASVAVLGAEELGCGLYRRMVRSADPVRM